jgi:hypothetical protein
MLRKGADPIYSKHHTAYTEHDFWKYMDSLCWPDLSDQKVNLVAARAHLSKHVTKKDLKFFKAILTEVCDSLRESFMHYTWFSEAEHHIQMDVLAHVVCKGQIVYHMAMDDPNIFQYVMTEHQSFWSCISEL